jgi:putative ABC transport system ATP-binding protein
MTAHHIAVRCQHISKTYDTGAQQVHALNDVNLDIPFGELMMLVGPSGCGKTTLISVIAGILDQDEGRCEIFGQDMKDLKPKERIRFRGQNIGFVFQAFNLLPTLSVAENVAIPLIINGMNRQKAIEMGKDALAQVGLGGRVNTLPSELSGGQQQRVAIARAIVHNPRLIVCDEPTSALDHETGHHIMEILKTAAKQEDRAMVIVTHDARIFEFADRIASMDDGQVLKVVDSAAQL